MECPLRRQAARAPDAPAIFVDGAVITWSQLDTRVTQTERELLDEGWVAGERIALLGHNSVELAALIIASARIGLTGVLLNARLTSTESSHLAQLAQAPAPTGVSPAPLSRSRHAATSSTPRMPAPRVTLTGEREIHPSARFVMFTSGTTGTPKGAVISVDNLTASARANRENLGPQERWLLCLPLFHIGGLAMLWRCLLDGSALVLHEKFDPARVLHALNAEAITHASLVPTTLRKLLDAREIPVFPSLRAILIGGGPSDDALLTRARARGLPVLWTYGLTEATSQAATQSPLEADGRAHAPPLPGVDVRIVDSARIPLPAGTPGDIELRGPTIMQGYLDNAEATAEVLSGDGWLRTRDLGILDEKGRLSILARRTDLILSGGENVYPAEVEAVLAGHPSVEDAAVVPLPDDTWGQVPGALIVPRGTVQILELEAFARARLAGFKVPRRWILVDTLPRNAMGKLDRAAAAKLLGV